MTRANNVHHLRRAAAERHHAAVDRARAATQELDRAGQPVNFTSVARAARVSRGWLYNQTDLRDAIVALRRAGPNAAPSAIPSTQRASTESLHERLDAARHDISRLRSENTALREQLGRALGEQRARR